MPQYPCLSEVNLPLLVTGIAGVAGYNAFQYYSRLYPGQVIGIRRDEYWPLSGDGIVGCDIINKQKLLSLFGKYQFRSVMSGLGTCRLKSCELDPAMAQRINVEGIRNLLAAIESLSHPVNLVHLSIDLVFSGNGTGDYTEDDLPDPVTVYGKTMLQAEALINEQVSTASIFRISLPMGISFSGHAGAIDWIQSRFIKDKPATLYFDEIRTPHYTDCLNKLTHWALTNEVSGLYHAGGPRALSLYEIAQIVNRVGGYNPDNLQGCQRIDAGPVPPRAGNVSLNSDKLINRLGFLPFDAWPTNELYVPTDRDWHYDIDTTIKGSPELLKAVLYKNPNQKNSC
ncbi:MAG: dTDP-4-dehydrorhamnose reductase [Planctomycetaceae bacterium]|nr:dTDP-4-dehydrorhamnose reductase [Planctomycetaceae bacterium]